jgi:hypothetical protein
MGSRSLGEFPLDVVRIECERCGRAGSYSLDGLIVRFGADIALPDLLVALSACERRADFSKPCGALHGLGRCRSLAVQAARRTLGDTKSLTQKPLAVAWTQARSGLLAGSCANGRRQVSPSLAQASHEPVVMIDALEKRLIEALKSVDAHGTLRNSDTSACPHAPV